MPGRFFVIFLLALMAFDQPKLVKTKIAQDITASIPAGWRPMDGMDFVERYPSVRAPLAAFTNEERMVDFSVNISATMWPDANLELAQRFFKSSLTNMFDRVDFISEGITTVNGKKLIFFEFESRVSGNRGTEGQRDPILKYSYIQYYVTKERTLVFTFNCPMRARQDWQATAHAMMSSVKIK